MNCSQARAMLAAYRELTDSQKDSLELERHLEGCAECREVLAQHTLIGRQVRSLPSIEPSPNAHARLMQALATEHVHFIQHTPSSATPIPTPTFLLPYLKQVQNTEQTNSFTAFSTANTGPLLLQAPRRSRRSYPMPQFAVIGLAAVFLIALMTGGLTSLFLLTNNHGGFVTANTAASIVQPQVTSLSYTTSTLYTHVASAVADQKSIYYTAYGDGSTGWMLEQFDSKTRTSTPLLAVASTTPLIVLGSSDKWLVWLELGAYKLAAKQGLNPNSARGWKLEATFIGASDATQEGITSNEPVTLLKGTFDPATTPAWIHTPIQGIWFAQGTLFVAEVDEKGISYLKSIQMDQNKTAITTMATTHAGHIFSSPTATSDGKDIYWSEEWMTDDNVPHSNIWTQQDVAVPVGPGRWAPHTITKTYPFRSDEMSFHPQVVNDTLFLLSTVPTDPTANTVQSTPQASATITPTITNELNTSVIRTDPLIYPAQLDDTIHGTLLGFSAEGGLPLQLPVTSERQVSDLQGGPRFLIWQNSNNAFEMYDVIAKAPVKVETIVPKDAIFLAVNGNTAVWTVNKENSDGSTNNPNTTSPTVSFSMFEWPTGTTTANGQ